jgi:hypothetical protein
MSEAYEGGAGTAGKQTRSFPKVNSAARRDDGACQNPWKPGQRRTRSESKPPVRLKALKGKNAGNLRPCRIVFDNSVMDVGETPRDRKVEKLRRVGSPATAGHASRYAKLQGAGRRCARRRKREGGWPGTKP